MNPNGTTSVLELSPDISSLMGSAITNAYKYLHNATNCIALVRSDNDFGIIKEDGNLIYLNNMSKNKGVFESSWKLWKDETDIGKMFNALYSVQLAKERGELGLKIEEGDSGKEIETGLQNAKDAPEESNGRATPNEEKELRLMKGKTATIESTKKASKNRKLVWSSSDEDIATVKDGKVKAVNYGSCIITCTYEDTGIVVLSRNVTVFQEAKSIQAI